MKKRMADNSKDNPDANCLPMGMAQMNAHPFPRKIIQTPTEVVLIYEGSGTTVREVFLDGRTLPTDPEPWWNGYSVGRWEGDTLVIETTGFMDDGWLDAVMVEDLSAFQVLKLLPRLLKSGELRTPRVHRMRVQAVKFTTDRPCMFHGDGEILGPTPAVIEVVPQAMRVLVPAQN